MTVLPKAPQALNRAAFSTLLLIALMMGANHVAARIAFNHGVDVPTAVAVRSLVTALAAVGAQGGFHLPNAVSGWWGLVALTFLYGTAFTIMFTLLPKLGVVGSSPIMNVEPVFALVLAWLILGQSIAPMQLVGAMLVVGAVMALGLRKGKA